MVFIVWFLFFYQLHKLLPIKSKTSQHNTARPSPVFNIIKTTTMIITANMYILRPLLKKMSIIKINSHPAPFCSEMCNEISKKQSWGPQYNPHHCLHSTWKQATHECKNLINSSLIALDYSLTARSFSTLLRDRSSSFLLIFVASDPPVQHSPELDFK